MGQDARMDSRPRLSNPFCRPLADPLRRDAAGWQRHPLNQLAGAVAAGAPLVALALWMYVAREGPMTLREMLGGPLIGGSVLVLWVLFVHLVACGDRLAGLGLRTDRPWFEGLVGVVGAGLLLALHVAIGGFLRRLFPPEPPPGEILELLGGLSRNPGLLALWLGPVVWIGIAGFEELWRVHLLRRLWRVWPGPLGRWAVIVFAAALVAGVHLYQPPAVMVSIGILSLLKGWYFLATGRFWSLVIAHALYDSVQIVAAVVAIRGG
ncbi:MAG: CPBP family intramembrane glutamic endopeptidase [Planctomycetota bacterium]|jgi:membrane protease YdiL (CAAX protease family)